MKEGRLQRCRVDAYPSGRIQGACIREEEGPSRPSGTHLVVLSALEQYPYQSSAMSGNRVSISTGEQYGDVVYHDRCAALTELENGTRIPIDEVIFHLSR